MKKLVLRLALLGAALLVVLVVAFGFALKPAARTAVEVGGSTALGVSTSLEDVLLGLGPSTSRLGLEGLVVQNPDGFDGPAFLDLGEASLQLATTSLLSETIRIPRIDLQGLKLRVVQSGTDSNLIQILQHLNAQLDGGDADVEPATEESGSGKALQVEHIHVAGVEAEFDLRGVPGVDEVFRFQVPDFDVDLTEEGRAETRQKAEDVIAATVDALVRQAFLAADTEMPAEVAALLQGDLSLTSLRARAEEQLRAKVDDVVEEKRDELLEEVGSELEEAVGEHLPGGLDGLLGGDGR